MTGAVLTSVFMGLSGFFLDAQALLLQRLLAGVASALVFIAGGLLAARLQEVGFGDRAAIDRATEQAARFGQRRQAPVRASQQAPVFIVEYLQNQTVALGEAIRQSRSLRRNGPGIVQHRQRGRHHEKWPWL